MFDYFYKRPYTLFSIIMLFFVLGIIGLKELPKNLFPDADRPQVIIVTKIPGATAQVAASSVSKPIEEEVARLSYVRDISSINVANFSIVKVEFEYKKGLKNAAVDVANALSIVKSKLPPNANPSIYTVGSFTLPVDVVSLSPKNNSITLGDIRKIADSFIKPYLLSIKDIGNVEVFGGYKSAITINIDPYKLAKYNISADRIIKALFSLDRDMPIGFMKSKDNFLTLTYYGEKDQIEKLKQLQIAPNLPLKSVADVKWDYEKRFSGYMGNGHPAIALAIQRAPKGSVLDVSNAAREAIKYLKKQYPNIKFEISDTQRNLILTSNQNMLEALRDAIIYTLIVLLLFLGNFRAIIAAGLSIPMVFFTTIAVIWLTGGELNIVVYTGIILSLGMLTDDAVVVLENIERHLNELKEDLNTAIYKGTKEVLGPVFAGTLSTIVVLFPLMFIGDYPQRIFQPLISTLIISLIVSYFLSVTFVPKLSAYLYKNGTKKTKIELIFENLYSKTIGKLIDVYIGVLRFSNSGKYILRRVILIVGVIVIFILSMKNIMPILGRDIMPPMDTGIVIAKIKFSSNSTADESMKKLKGFLNWLHKQPYVRMSSTAFGSEAGVLSLGNGNLPSEATITINCVDRFHRKLTIWQIESIFRDKLNQLEGIKNVDVYDFGATPLSSIKAPLDIRIKSATYEGLSDEANIIAKNIRRIKGLTSIDISWDSNFKEITLNIDTNKALSYGLTPAQIIAQIPINGRIAAINGDFTSMNSQFVRIYLKGKFNENINSIRLLPIKTPFGYYIPLQAVAKFKEHFTPAKIERDQLLYSLDVNGFRNKKPITMITADSQKILKHLNTEGFKVEQAGSIVQLNDSFKRMLKAIVIGVILLTMTLIAVYRSVRMGLVMIVVLPLSMIGAFWAMLIFHKPSCMPSMMGILLLFGIIIKNSVLLIDFYQHYREKESPFESALESVRVRFRPVMMTAFGTIAGMIPIALERAVGLERLSPLADVAVGGLLVGTFLTLVYVPMFAYMLDSATKKNKSSETTP
ncbi:efflux RND transporter permease subunit [Hippea sp. KM1]|uniref:efflux RND transporter permease subunit n=1 Tax=Hippea sp. KM1 TaxID=944481 RepID=UPI00046CE376|nr:efflux RND transporter permease subunit [Hippea sp. KM1]